MRSTPPVDTRASLSPAQAAGKGDPKEPLPKEQEPAWAQPRAWKVWDKHDQQPHSTGTGHWERARTASTDSQNAPKHQDTAALVQLSLFPYSASDRLTAAMERAAPLTPIQALTTQMLTVYSHQHSPFPAPGYFLHISLPYSVRASPTMQLHSFYTPHQSHLAGPAPLLSASWLLFIAVLREDNLPRHGCPRVARRRRLLV